MNENAKRAAVRFVLFALLGLLLEVFFTASGSLLRGNWNMRGHTSPWMMLDYGLLGVLVLPISGRLKAWHVPLVARAVVYMLLIFLVEYVSGMIFTHLLGLRIWDYSQMRYNLHGQIVLSYAPFWFLLGLFAEHLHRKIDAFAVVLLRGVTVEDLDRLR